MTYTFFCRDYYLNDGDYNISGDHYVQLLEICFRYSVFFTVKGGSAQLINDLKNWEYPERKCVPIIGCAYYYSNKNTRAILLAHSTSLFAEEDCTMGAHIRDLTFYREDGSIFMETISHEGECSIFSGDEEDISDILAYDHWLPINDSGKPEIPAKLCNLPIPAYHEIVSERFYLVLREIQKKPQNYFLADAITELHGFILKYRPINNGYILDADNNKMSHLPPWYYSFQFFLLAKCNAMSSTPIDDALLKETGSEENAFYFFFSLLDDFIENSKKAGRK